MDGFAKFFLKVLEGQNYKFYFLTKNLKFFLHELRKTFVNIDFNILYNISICEIKHH